MDLIKKLVDFMQCGYRITFRAWCPVDHQIIVDIENAYRGRKISRYISEEIFQKEELLIAFLEDMVEEFERENDPAL